MKTAITIIGTDVDIVAHNNRERDMAHHFLIELECASEICADDGDDNALWSRCKKIGGMADAMHWLGMLGTGSLYVWNLVAVCRKNARNGSLPFMDRVEREV